MKPKKRNPKARWPDNANKRSKRRQDPDDPQPRKPAGRTQRGGKQDAEELKRPPMRTGLNGGLLRSGGTNQGGNGATPALLRSRCRDALAIDGIFEIPVQIILDDYATPKEKLDAWKALAQYGGLAAMSLTDSDGNPVELPPFIVERMTGVPAAPADEKPPTENGPTLEVAR
jgi:hypothetical protein